MVDDTPSTASTDHDPAARLALALELVAAGYVLAPVRIHRDPRTGKKAPDYLWEGPGTGWHDRASSDPAQVLDWWAQYGDNVSFLVDTGRSGVVGLDLDVVAARTDPETGETFPEVDAVVEWAMAALPSGDMLVNTPSGGQHHYWAADHADVVLNAKRVLGLPVDVRGEGGHLFAPGAVVLGPDGEPEAGGLYTLQGPLVPAGALSPLPAELVTKLAEPARERRAPTAQGELHDRRWVIDQCQMQLEKIRGATAREGTGFRSMLLGAGMVLGRAVAGGLITRAYAERKLSDAVFGVWGSVDADDARWIRDGLDDGQDDPWTIVRTRPETPPSGPLSPSAGQVGSPGTTDVSRSTPEIGVTEGEQAHDPETALEASPEEIAARIRARKLAEETERQEIRAEAARTIAVRNLPELRALDVDAFLDAPKPRWLVPGFLYRDATAKVYGPPGGTKSFALLDIALSLASGRSWHGRELEACPVHYVMAEGQAVNALRAHAWMAHHGVGREELAGFTAIPQGVLLTPEGIARYLALVARDQPGLIILDTKNRMMVGEENSASDVAVMVQAMDALRTLGGSNVTLVDHTGLHDTTRGRGSNAVTAAMDSEVRVSYANGLGVAEVTRDKAGEIGLQVAYRLHTVEGVQRPPGIAAPAVCVPASAQPQVSTEFGTGTAWWDLHTWPLPADVVDYSGKGAAAVKPLALYMRHAAADPSAPGVSRQEAVRAVMDHYQDRYGVDTVKRAWDALLVATEGPKRISPATPNPTGRAHWRTDPHDPQAFGTLTV